MAPVAAALGEQLGGVRAAATWSATDAQARGVGPRRRRGRSLLENLRFDPGEEANDAGFAAALAGLAEAYVDDAFGAAHRAHASVVGVPARLNDAVPGRCCSRSWRRCDGCWTTRRDPSWRSSGGAKVSDKLAVIDSLLDRASTAADRRRDVLHVPAGAGPRGRVEPRRGRPARHVPRDLVTRRPKARAAAAARPTSSRRTSSSPTPRPQVVPAEAIPEGWMGLDVGPDTVDPLRRRDAERGHRAVERPDGRVRVAALRGRHERRRPGRRGLRRVHRDRRRRQRGRDPPAGPRRPGRPRQHRRRSVAGVPRGRATLPGVDRRCGEEVERIVARKPLIAGNWKSHLDHLEAIQLVQQLNYHLDERRPRRRPMSRCARRSPRCAASRR